MNIKLMAASVALSVGTIPTVFADHSWADYHWARTTSSFNLTIINSTTSDWDPYVSQAVADWSQSNVLNMVEDLNGDTSTRTRRKCNSPDGMIRICNLEYGQNGWLGIAGISLDNNGHITTGYTKMNDTYFNMAYYSGADWKQSVTCQELGHNVGLDHQDENFNNQSLFSCMDYQDPPYEYPNNHDYQQLSSIYSHTDSYDSYASEGSGGGGSGCNSPAGKGCNKAEPNDGKSVGWGRSIYKRGNAEVFLRIDPDGTRHLTHVTWAIGHENHDH
ncbi:hypothetical protein OPS25_05060 [Alteromonas ponticola]|uniref:Matrixin family metalloprotease n=1 Tax=Alteromonas aquimaris TaxID=2998417 RepID=A0ABT3P711_9ALTE|nr:hypothetical protein [Alteromonas aquimaris]MCW8107866.1 hypothetical protein [Alteromonas aquimaris]